MAKPSSLTNQEIDQIYLLADQGNSERKIAAELGITKSKVHNILVKRVGTEAQQKVAAMIATPAAQEVRKSVFDIMAQLEKSLELIEKLQEEAVPSGADEEGGKTNYHRLDHRVAVLTERRMLIAEARATLESIYNIRVLNDFISEVTAILESETPGARQRIYKRLEVSTGATAAVGLFTPGSRD